MKMNISLFQGVLMGVFVVGALVGLFVFATYTSNSGGGNTIGPVVIWGTLPRDDFQKAITAIVEVNEALKSVTYEEKNAATLSGELASAIATGASPDLVLASQEELMTLAKFITPIPLGTVSERMFTSTFIGEGDLLRVPFGGGYFGIPVLLDPLVLFSNRGILSSNGIAKPPATWEALTGLVPNIAELTPNRQIIRGLVALGTYDNIRNARSILSALLLQQNVPISVYRESGDLIADLGRMGGAIPAGPAVLGFYTQFADPSKVSYTWNPSLRNSRQAFVAGDLALYLGFASEARFLTPANPNLDFDISPLPQPATAKLKGTYGLLYSLMIPRGAKNPGGAFQVAATLTNPFEQGALASATGLAPATLTPLSEQPSDPVAAVAYASALYAKGWLSPLPADTDRIFSGMITDVTSGRSSLTEAISTAEQTLSALF